MYFTFYTKNCIIYIYSKNMINQLRLHRQIRKNNLQKYMCFSVIYTLQCVFQEWLDKFYALIVITKLHNKIFILNFVRYVYIFTNYASFYTYRQIVFVSSIYRVNRCIIFLRVNYFLDCMQYISNIDITLNF